MRGIETLAGAGAAVNIGILFGALLDGDGLTFAAIFGGLLLTVINAAPFVLAMIQGKRRSDQRWAPQLLVGAMVVSIVVAVVLYPRALQRPNLDGIIFAAVPMYQLVLVGLALAVADFLRSRDRSKTNSAPSSEPGAESK